MIIFIIMQAGIMEELIEDTFESMEDEDLDELADQEIDKILFEVTKGKQSSTNNHSNIIKLQANSEVLEKLVQHYHKMM